MLRRACMLALFFAASPLLSFSPSSHAEGNLRRPKKNHEQRNRQRLGNQRQQQRTLHEHAPQSIHQSRAHRLARWRPNPNGFERAPQGKGSFETLHWKRYDRKVEVYLPAGYHANPNKHYPVLYLQDGQNVFGKRGWNVDGAIEHSTGNRRSPQVIVVAIHNAGSFEGRVWEYAPSSAKLEIGGKKITAGGGAKDYLNYLISDVKTMVDSKYRTRSDAHHTAIGGSSMGGLLSWHAVTSRPDVFGRAMVMSPSFFWNGQSTLAGLKQRASMPNIKLYLDSGGVDSVGTRDGSAHVDRIKKVLENLKAPNGELHFQHGRNFQHFFAPRHDHAEWAWRERFPRAFEFLFSDIL